MHRIVLYLAVVWTICTPAAGAFEARLLSSLGDVTVTRGRQRTAVCGRVPLAAGDRIQTALGSGASAAVDDSIIYMSGGAAVTLGGSSEGELLQLGSGAIRVVVVNGAELAVSAPKLHVVLTEGIYQFAVERSQTQLHTIAGRAVIVSGTRGPSVARRLVMLASFQDSDQNTILPGESIAVPPVAVGDGSESELAQESPEERRLRESLQDQGAEEAESELAGPEDEPLPDEDMPPSTRGAEPSSLASALGTQSYVSSPGISTSFGGLSASFSLASGGLFADAMQDTDEGQIDSFPRDGVPDGGPFPGTIHLLTAESRYAIDGVALTQAERNAIFPTAGNEPVYYSLGVGALPTAQVFTEFRTASETTPTAYTIPGFDRYALKFTDFDAVDAGLDPAGASVSGIGMTGLVGADPMPFINNATPSEDERARLNPLATFGLGEVRLRMVGDQFEVAVRYSDQDRLIVQDGGGNDANDLVTPHPDVEFVTGTDPVFQPGVNDIQFPVPTSFDNTPTRFSQLNDLRRAAVTTIMAHELFDFAQRTGQTRFVVDGRIVDISGYQK